MVGSVLTFVVFFAIATAVLTGQSEIAAPARWWQNPVIQHDLRLTSKQVRRLDSIFERDLPARIALHRQIAQVDRELQRMIDLEADVAVVMRLSDEVEQLRAERNVRRTLMLVAMYKTLTLAQRARLFVIPRSSEPAVR
jgi:Spy/CpxP family protein refolding chaperone